MCSWQVMFHGCVGSPGCCSGATGVVGSKHISHIISIVPVLVCCCGGRCEMCQLPAMTHDAAGPTLL